MTLAMDLEGLEGADDKLEGPKGAGDKLEELEDGGDDPGEPEDAGDGTGGAALVPASAKAEPEHSVEEDYFYT